MAIQAKTSGFFYQNLDSFWSTFRLLPCYLVKMSSKKTFLHNFFDLRKSSFKVLLAHDFVDNKETFYSKQFLLFLWLFLESFLACTEAHDFSFSLRKFTCHVATARKGLKNSLISSGRAILSRLSCFLFSSYRL